MSEAILEYMRPQPTGGMIVTFAKGVDRTTREDALRRRAVTHARTYSMSSADPGEMEAASDDEALIIDEMSIALIGRSAADTVNVAADFGDMAVEVRPEFYVYAIGGFTDTAQHTWGADAVAALSSPQDGTGINLAILDTGLDFDHPDFAGRTIVERSFVSGQTSQDVQGHGTHCAGTAAGRAPGGNVPRYGIAPCANLHVGKVLNDSGTGRELDILRGMAWAVQQDCAVISMSLGRPVRAGETFSQAYERAGETALDAGCLVVAAAGNESQRDQGFIAAVGAPANSPSIMAVAAIDAQLDVAGFSCGGINGNGGEVDIAGPGVGVFSSVPRPALYRALQGTSMACPHIAGVAALWAQSDATLRGRALWNRLVSTARPLSLLPRDVGAGLVQAPGVAQEDRDGAEAAMVG